MLVKNWSEKLSYVGVITAIVLGFYLSSLYSYFLFHSLVEITTIAIGFTLFILTWNTRRFLTDDCIKLLGIGYAFIAFIDLFHTLAYKGMNVFPGFGANLPTQLWIGARCLQAATLCAAPIFTRRRISEHVLLGGYFTAVSVIAAVVYSGNFPDCYVEGKGLTPFKVISEYAITAILLTSLFLFHKRRTSFNDRVYALIVSSIACTAISEIAFTAYLSVYGFVNMFGHLLRLAAYYLIYRALLVTGLKEPFDLIFRDLKNAKESLRKAHDTLEEKVRERTAALRESEQQFRTLIESMPDQITGFDTKGRIRYINPRVTADFGVTPEMVIGRTLDEIDTPGSATEDVRFLDAIRQAVVEGVPNMLEAIWRTVRGERLFEVHHIPELGSDGKVSGVLGIARDITERKRAEESVRLMGLELQTIYDNTYTLLAYLDRDSNFIRVNRAYAEAAGQHPDFFIGKNHFELYPHTENEAIFRRVVETGRPYIAHAKPFEYPDHPEWGVTYWDWTLVPVFSAERSVTGLIFTLLNVTERKRAEEERLAHYRFFESMDRVNRAIQGTNDLEQMMRDVLDAVLTIFDCDRAFLMYPCDPEAAAWRVPMERNRPEYPGVFVLGLVMPMDDEVAGTLRILLDSDGPVKFGPGTGYPLPADVSERFGFKSFMSMALHPRVDKPWQFGIHQCSYPRVWTPEEERLLQEIGRRLTDGQTSLLTYRNLRESEARLAEAQRIAKIGNWEWDVANNKLWWSYETFRVFGIKPEEFGATFEGFINAVHPDDRERVQTSIRHALQHDSGGWQIDYRIARADGTIRFVHEEAETVFDRDSRPLKRLGTVQDITERKQAAEALQANQRKLSEMAVELSLAEERERRRIAAELHDRIGQTLLLGKIKFDALAKKHGSMANDGMVEDIRLILNEAINDVRSLTQQLHPPMLAGVGLGGALDWLCMRMGADYGLRVEFVDDKCAKPLTEELRSVVYQAARELLINVAKHADTDSARLFIGRDGQMLKLVVEDLGGGLDLQANSAKGAGESGFGLFNIRERITYLGGDVTVETTPGQGTCVTLRAPLIIEASEGDGEICDSES